MSGMIGPLEYKKPTEIEQIKERITRLEHRLIGIDVLIKHPMLSISNTIMRNDTVKVFGLLWRVDWIDGGWLGISNDRGEHKEVHSNAVERMTQMQGISEIRQQMVDDIVNQV